MQAMTQAPAFWDRIAERYAAQPVRNPQAYEHTLERVRAYLKPSDRALELGCGCGAIGSNRVQLAAKPEPNGGSQSIQPTEANVNVVETNRGAIRFYVVVPKSIDDVIGITNASNAMAVWVPEIFGLCLGIVLDWGDDVRSPEHSVTRIGSPRFRQGCKRLVILRQNFPAPISPVVCFHNLDTLP